MEAALETAHPKVGLNIIQNPNSAAIIISNSFQENSLALHKLKQKDSLQRKAIRESVSPTHRKSLVRMTIYFWRPQNKAAILHNIWRFPPERSNKHAEHFWCEDDAVQAKIYCTDYKKYGVDLKNLDMQLILDTPNPYELLETVKTSQNTGIYFLDIDLKCDMNGMKLAQQIRLYDPRCFIIFVTSPLRTKLYDFPVPGRSYGFCPKRQSCRSKGTKSGNACWTH